jgi:hypothetical protein
LQAFDADVAHRERLDGPAAVAASALATTAATVRRRKRLKFVFICEMAPARKAARQLIC